MGKSQNPKKSKAVPGYRTPKARRSLAPPGSVAAVEFLQAGDGDLRVGLDLEVEHSGDDEISSVSIGVRKCLPRRDGPGRHHLERHPRFVDCFHVSRRLLGVVAPHVVIVRVVVGRVASHPVIFVPPRLGCGRPVAVPVKRLDVVIRVELVLLAGDRHVQRVAADSGRHALGFDQVDHLSNHVDLASAHHVFVRHPSVRIQQRRAEVHLTLYLLVHLGLILDQRDADHGLDLRGPVLVVLRHWRPALWIDLDRIDAAGLAEFQGLEDFCFGVVRREQLRGVHQVAAVGPPADQVATHQ